MAGPWGGEKKPRKCDKSFVSKFANTLLVGYKLFHFRAAKFVFTKSHRKQTRTWHWRSFELETKKWNRRLPKDQPKQKENYLGKSWSEFPGLIRSKIRRRLIANPKKMTSEMMKTMFFRSCFQFGTHATTHFSIWAKMKKKKRTNKFVWWWGFVQVRQRRPSFPRATSCEPSGGYTDWQKLRERRGQRGGLATREPLVANGGLGIWNPLSSRSSMSMPPPPPLL